jgi:hypothetical protein
MLDFAERTSPTEEMRNIMHRAAAGGASEVAIRAGVAFQEKRDIWAPDDANESAMDAISKIIDEMMEENMEKMSEEAKVARAAGGRAKKRKAKKGTKRGVRYKLEVFQFSALGVAVAHYNRMQRALGKAGIARRVRTKVR